MLDLDKPARRIVSILALVALLCLIGFGFAFCQQRKAAQEARGGAIIADGRTGAASDASAVRDRSEARNAAIDQTVSQGTDDVRKAPDRASRNAAALRSLCKLPGATDARCWMLNADPK